MITKDKYEEYLELIKSMYFKSKSYMVIFNLINEKRTDRLVELNYAPGFFNIVILSLRESIIISLSKLLEKNSKSFSIYKFINLTSANLHLLNYYAKNSSNRKLSEKITSSMISEFRSSLMQFEDFHDRLVDIRDIYFAHFDFNSIKEKKVIDIDEKEIEDFLKVVHNILQKISIAFKGESFSQIIYDSRDLCNLLDELNRSRIKTNIKI